MQISIWNLSREKMKLILEVDIYLEVVEIVSLNYLVAFYAVSPQSAKYETIGLLTTLP